MHMYIHVRVHTDTDIYRLVSFLGNVVTCIVFSEGSLCHPSVARFLQSRSPWAYALGLWGPKKVGDFVLFRVAIGCCFRTCKA